MRLRRVLCASLVMLPIVDTVRAQSAAPASTPRVGLTAGINSSTLSGADVDVSRKTGAMIGVVTVFPVGSSFAIQPEMLYTMKGDKVRGFGTLRINYFEIPLLLRFDATTSGRAKPFFYGGPALALRASCGFEAQDAGVTVNLSCDGTGLKTVDYSLVVGGGLAFNIAAKTLTMGARYDHSLSKFAEDGDSKHRVISVLATFEFPWK